MTTPASRYVCAFRGRRDDYQVPLALAERLLLEEFITDAYATVSLRRVAKFLPGKAADAINFRYQQGIPDGRVKSLWGTTAVEHLRHGLGFSRALTYAKLDQSFSQQAAQSARRARSNLLLYTPYAWEAFTARYRHPPKRVLFQYHPHSDFEHELLRRDAEIYPEIVYSFAQETGQGLPERLRDRVQNCWRYADQILCASSFTRRTLLEAGANQDTCFVIPYGVDGAHTELPTAETKPREGFHALFVGSGVQRKGLHHLLRAWRQASLPSGSSLTLVCRTLDPGLRGQIAQTAGVRFLAGVEKEELDDLYKSSSLFVMPSLTEGFGQVYLEALIRGCPVLGTSNTCLPDIGTEADGVFLANVGNLDNLTYQLERLSLSLSNEPNLRSRAQMAAQDFTWPRFRTAVASHL